MKMEGEEIGGRDARTGYKKGENHEGGRGNEEKAGRDAISRYREGGRVRTYDQREKSGKEKQPEIEARTGYKGVSVRGTLSGMTAGTTPYWDNMVSYTM